MRFLSEKRIAAVLVGIGVFLVALPVIAAETSNSEFVIIQEDDVLPDDLYAGAIRVVIDGTVDGDLIAFAAQEVVINGTVTGSVMAVSPSVKVTGEVGESLRVTGNRLEVTGSVGRDLVAAVVNAELGPDSEVAGDALIWAWGVEALGTIGQDLGGTQRNLDLAGSIGGDVDVSVHRLVVVDDLTVSGDFDYRSSNDAQGLEMATVAGAVVAKSPLPPNLRVRALGLLGRFMIVLFLSIAALTTAYGWPDRTVRAIAEVGRKPIRHWLTGAVLIFAPLVAVALAGLLVGLAPPAAAFPLLAVMVPVILALFGVSFALALV
ncbi:MAG: hypothetical protein WAL25_13550, partial [Acidimicrobiia bacterium]